MNTYRNHLGRGGGGGRGAVAAVARPAGFPSPTQALPGRSGWRGGVIPPWLDCDVDEDGQRVCPDDFYFGALGGRGYRDWDFAEPTGGRYTYRQFDNGEIYILEAPKRGRLKSPIYVKRGSKAWHAISSAIYAKKQGKKAAVANAFTKIALVSSALVTANAAPPKNQKASPEEVPSLVEEAPAPPPEESESFPWIPVGVAGAAVVALLAFFGGGKS